jgi:hypothetical protein
MADESSSDLSLHEEHLGKPCDLCGESCEANQELCVPLRAMHCPAPLTPRLRSNLLGCSYPACQLLACCYHQDCLERYLKSIRCERCVCATACAPVASLPPHGAARLLTQSPQQSQDGLQVSARLRQEDAVRPAMPRKGGQESPDSPARGGHQAAQESGAATAAAAAAAQGEACGEGRVEGPSSHIHPCRQAGFARQASPASRACEAARGPA